MHPALKICELHTLSVRLSNDDIMSCLHNFKNVTHTNIEFGYLGKKCSQND